MQTNHHMALHLSLLLLFYRLSAVSHVSVQTGGSITIPCLYHQDYRNHVKYWCSVLGWAVCYSLVRTDHLNSSKVSISDDINKSIFTVTMTDLSSWDTGNYRCVVEINRGPDIMIQRFYLSVTPGTPALHVDQQEVTGVEGGSVTVRCYFSKSGDMKWCRMGGDCVSGNSGTSVGTSVTIQQIVDDNSRTFLTVTMSGLKMENTDWYWCRMGEQEMPVHITVREQTATQNITAITTQGPTTQQPSASPTAEPVQTDNTSQGAEGNMGDVHQRSMDVKVLLIPWGMLVVVTAGILVTWKMWRKHKDKKAKDQTPNNSVQDPFPEYYDDVTYSTVILQHKAQLKGQTKQRAAAAQQ